MKHTLGFFPHIMETLWNPTISQSDQSAEGSSFRSVSPLIRSVQLFLDYFPGGAMDLAEALRKNSRVFNLREEKIPVALW